MSDKKYFVVYNTLNTLSGAQSWDNTIATLPEEVTYSDILDLHKKLTITPSQEIVTITFYKRID